MSRALPLALPLLCGGCAANLATLMGPETLAPGDVLVATEAGASLPVGVAARAAQAGTNLAIELADYGQDGDQVPLEAISEAVAAGMGLALSPPGTVYGVAARVGVLDGLDVGGRLSTSDWRLDARYQLAGNADKNRQSALMGGLLRHRFHGLVFDFFDPIQAVSTVIPGLEIDEPSRWDVELVYLNGRAFGEHLKTYSALSGRLGWYRVPWFLTGEDYGWPEIVSADEVRGLSPTFAATGGLAVGYAPVWLRGELNLAYSYARTEVLGVPVDFGGLTIFPALSLEVTPKRRRSGDAPTGP